MKSTRGVNVILKGRKDDKHGYLKISIRKGGKTVVYSLGIKVQKKDFNPRTQLMRASAPNAEEINDFIEVKVNSLAYHPYRSGNIKSICIFIQKVINETNVKSTRQKYVNILNLFQEFLSIHHGKEDLFFEEIDNFVITGFYNYLLNKEVRNTANTANYKMKAFKSFFSKIKRQNLYYWPTDPFVSLKLRFEDVKRDYLTFEEFKTLMNKDFKETRFRTSEIKFQLIDIKNAFAFSTMAQGLRISDILTLRWNDFYFELNDFNKVQALVIRKKMIKTKKLVHVFLDNFSSQLLITNILRVIPEGYEKERLEICIDDKLRIQEQIHQVKLNDFIGEEDSFDLRKANFDSSNVNKEDGLTNYLESSSMELLKNDLEQINHDIFFQIYGLVKALATNHDQMTKFVFPFLDDTLFRNIDADNDFSILTDRQFLQFQGRRSYINKLTKDLILKPISPNKKLSFHSARHTYTSMVLQKDEIGINIYDLMKSLGHTSILSTEKYIQGFNHEKISRLNSELSKSLMAD